MAVKFEPSMLLAILPELSLVLLAGLLLVLDLLKSERKNNLLGWVAAGGLALIALTALLFARPPQEPALLFGGMIRWDLAGFVFRMIFIIGAALTAIFAMDNENLGQRGEFLILLVISTLGMSLMASAADLIMLYLAIETTSIPLYVLAGFLRQDQKSAESGVKYLLFGAMTSAVMLYGFSLLYGFTGTTQLYGLSEAMQAAQLPVATIIGSLILVLVGFGFKVSAVPFHFWAPDVYEGSPTPVAGFLSTASKAAGFVVLMRVMMVVFPQVAPAWTLLVALLSTASMFVGNILALAQKNIKRLLAYSSIAQAGYMLIGVAANSQLGATAATYYLMAYLLTNMVAFGLITMVGRELGSDEISAYAGLSRRSPGLALILLAALLSLGGIPPFGGFIGKLLVLGSAVEAGMIWLAVLGVINSIIALYYYLSVLKVVYLYRSEEEDKPLKIKRVWSIALTVCTLGVIFAGTVMAPLFTWSTGAAVPLLFY